MKKLFLIPLLLLFIFSCCNADVKDLVITKQNKDEIIEKVRNGKDLTGEEVGLFLGAITKATISNQSIEGKTVRELINDQSKLAEDAKAKEAEAKRLSFIVQIFQKIRSTDLLTSLALLLAYIAYTWSVNRDLDAWKSLFVSFKNDLESQRSWLVNEYYGERYKDKDSFNPYKIIYPLSFESLPEIIQRGVAEFSWIPPTFIKQLSLFNERVIAFNDLLDHIKKSVTANPILSEKLKDKLNELGLHEGTIKFDDFKKDISKRKKEDNILYLAEQIRRLNRIVHVNLISNRENKDKLHFLYYQINSELENILTNFDKKRPFFIRWKWLFVLLSILSFILIETVLE